MIRFVFWLLYQGVGACSVLMIVYFFMTWLNMGQNRFCMVVGRFIEPVVDFVRRLITKLMNNRLFSFDVAPLATWLILQVIHSLLAGLMYFR